MSRWPGAAQLLCCVISQRPGAGTWLSRRGQPQTGSCPAWVPTARRWTGRGGEGLKPARSSRRPVHAGHSPQRSATLPADRPSGSGVRALRAHGARQRKGFTPASLYQQCAASGAIVVSTLANQGVRCRAADVIVDSRRCASQQDPAAPRCCCWQRGGANGCCQGLLEHAPRPCTGLICGCRLDTATRGDHPGSKGLRALPLPWARVQRGAGLVRARPLPDHQAAAQIQRAEARPWCVYVLSRR